METTFKHIQVLAQKFIDTAEKFNEQVSAYLCGSVSEGDRAGYTKVKDAYRAFVAAYNAYYEDGRDDAIDYDLAFSVLG